MRSYYYEAKASCEVSPLQN